MEKVIPRSRWFNPHAFNRKEHATIIIIASTAAQSVFAIEVIAVQRLFYDAAPNALISILIILSSQLVAFGFAGLLRRALVHPTKMVWPSLLPMTTLLDTLHRDQRETAKRLRLFYGVFAAIFIWELFPEYVMPVLTGVSVFCLAKRDSLLFTHLFGGSTGNEGLGILSLGFDWQFITSEPLWFPLETLSNYLIGYVICICLFIVVYYGNVWRAQDFPFLSQLLFSDQSNTTNLIQYNHTAILDHNIVRPDALEKQGTPYFSATYAIYLLMNNLAITATITHLLLWNWDDMKKGYSFLSPRNLFSCRSQRSQSKNSSEKEDLHYQKMRVYKACPNWWYLAVLVLAIAAGAMCVGAANSTLPWYSFIISVALSGALLLFFGAQTALTGFEGNVQPVVQMLGGFLQPGRPLANMYFTLFGFNSVVQGITLVQDLKFGQYAKIPPRITFAAQILGTMIGSVFTYIIMAQITENQRDTLLSVQGTNVWSGQSIQQFNTQVSLPLRCSPSTC